MQASAVQEHWRDWAVQYGAAERATTLCSSIKRLEVAALHRTIDGLLSQKPWASILEVGCGNGQNIVALAKAFEPRRFKWCGIDYVPEMVQAARKNAEAAGLKHCSFLVGDIRDLPGIYGYDLIFTDRLLINLSTVDEQISAINAMSDRLHETGDMILIENSRQTKDAQNDLRQLMGLSRRKDAEFNLFLDDTVIIPHLRSLFDDVVVEDFGSLHDILLYVLLPATLGVEFQYEHPIMARVADLCEKVNIPAGAFGQNRMYVCR